VVWRAVAVVVVQLELKNLVVEVVELAMKLLQVFVRSESRLRCDLLANAMALTTLPVAEEELAFSQYDHLAS
jgi:hypothetical protein